jgi:hypothetical protein
MTASLGIRLVGTSSDPRPRRRRSSEFRFGARRPARLLMSNCCFSNKDSATTARTPPGRTSLAMVANRWTARMSRWIMDADGSTMSVSHKTARDCARIYEFAMDNLKADITISSWQVRSRPTDVLRSPGVHGASHCVQQQLATAGRFLIAPIRVDGIFGNDKSNLIKSFQIRPRTSLCEACVNLDPYKAQ